MNLDQTQREQVSQMTTEVRQWLTNGGWKLEAPYFKSSEEPPILAIAFMTGIMEHLLQAKPVGWQVRRYYTDSDDEGWGNWHQVTGADLEFYQQQTQSESKLVELRPIYA